jgi:hypothetical protein
MVSNSRVETTTGAHHYLCLRKLAISTGSPEEEDAEMREKHTTKGKLETIIIR